MVQHMFSGIIKELQLRVYSKVQFQKIMIYYMLNGIICRAQTIFEHMRFILTLARAYSASIGHILINTRLAVLPKLQTTKLNLVNKHASCHY